MYVPKPFAMEDRVACYDLIDQWSFGDLITCHQGDLFVNHIPFVLDRENHRLLGHMARQNPQMDMLSTADDLLVVFKGENAYISPTWYTSPNMVPTWNYRVVQCRGRAKLLDDAQLLEVITLLSAKHEASFPKPWTVDKVAPRPMEAMMRAIVGFEIAINSIDGKDKMSQNRSDSDRSGVITGLKGLGDSMADEVASKIPL